MSRRHKTLYTPLTDIIIQSNATIQPAYDGPPDWTFLLLIRHFFAKLDIKIPKISTMGNSQTLPSADKPKTLQNSSIVTIKKRFLLEDHHIEQLFAVFSEIDKSHNGHITIEDLLRFLHKQQNSMVIPALYRLFSLMSDDSERLFFDQWVDGLMVFCLYNKEYLIRFVFDILDTDEDGYVLKKEILKYVEYTNPKTGEPVFHTNFLQPIESIKLTKFYLISFDDFRKFCDLHKFLCWPAIKLQEDLRESIMGNSFWDKIYAKIEKRQSEMKNNNKKDNANEEKKMEEKSKINASKLSQVIKTKKIDRNLFKIKMGDRKPGQIGSDTNICFQHIAEINKPQHRFSHLSLKRANSTVYIKGAF